MLQGPYGRDLYDNYTVVNVLLLKVWLEFNVKVFSKVLLVSSCVVFLDKTLCTRVLVTSQQLARNPLLHSSLIFTGMMGQNTVCITL